MKFCKISLFSLITSLSFIFISNTFALDPMAKEETTPPPAEGAITAEQVPPMYSDQNKVAPPASTSPTINNQPTAPTTGTTNINNPPPTTPQ